MPSPHKQEGRMTEAQIHKAVVQHWRACGLPDTLVATIPNMGAMGQFGLTKGLPDLMVCGLNIGVGFIELKAEKGRLSPAQKEFGDLARKLGLSYAVTFGREEPIKVLEDWDIVRSTR